MPHRDTTNCFPKAAHEPCALTGAAALLQDISDEDILPGFVLTSRGETACPAVRRFEAQLRVVELLEHKSIFSAGYTAILHVHAAAEECVILELTSAIDKKTGVLTQ